MKRTWTTTDGVVHHKVYDKIKGIDAKEYKRVHDKKYNERLKEKSTGNLKNVDYQRAKLTDELTDANLTRIKELRDLGLSFAKIAKQFNLSSYHIKTALTKIENKKNN